MLAESAGSVVSFDSLFLSPSFYIDCSTSQRAVKTKTTTTALI